MQPNITIWGKSDCLCENSSRDRKRSESKKNQAQNTLKVLSELKSETGYDALKENEKVELDTALTNAGGRGVIGAGRAYLLSDAVGRKSILALLNMDRADSNVDMSIRFISKIGETRSLASDQNQQVFAKFAEVASRLPEFSKDNKPLDSDTRREIRAGAKEISSYGDLIEMVVRGNIPTSSERSYTRKSNDPLDYAIELLGGRVSAFLICK